MRPFHGIGGAKGQSTREHLIEADAERVEIAAEVDRSVHASGLFGRHVGECAGEGIRRLGSLSIRGEARCKTNPGEPRITGRRIDQDAGRFEVPVNEAALVEFAQGRRNTDRQAQEASHLHGHADELMERLVACIVEYVPIAVAHWL